MTYKLTIKENPDYLHVVVTGKNSKKIVVQYLQEILRVRKTRNCRKLLIEERLTGPRLDIFPIFEIVNDASSQAIGLFDAIAYVDVNSEGDLMQFAETVAANRGIPVNVFATVTEAESWLTSISSATEK